MPNNCLSVLYKHIIQVENENGLKGGGGGGTNIPLPPNKKFNCMCRICNKFNHVNDILKRGVKIALKLDNNNK